MPPKKRPSCGKTPAAKRMRLQRSSETEEQHEARLQTQCKRQATLRENETFEQHEARLQTKRERQAAIRENETFEQHQARLKTQRERRIQQNHRNNDTLMEGNFS